MAQIETVTIPASCRGELLHRRKHIEACTFASIVLTPNVINDEVEVTIEASHRDDIEAAKDRIQRTVDSQAAWARSGGRALSTLFSRLAKHNYPDFTNGSIRGLRYANLGPARNEAAYYEDLFEGPNEDLVLTNSVLPLIGRIDEVEEQVHSKAARGADYEANRQHYKNLSAAALDFLTKKYESQPPPSKDRVIVACNLQKEKDQPPITHHEVAGKFEGNVLDVVFMRRASADLSMRPKAYVVFESADDASRALRTVPHCEQPRDFNQYNDSIKRRLLVLQCIVEEVPLSSQSLRGTGLTWHNMQHVRHAIVRRNRALDDQLNAQAQDEREVQPQGQAHPPPAAIEDIDVANLDDNANVPIAPAPQLEEQPAEVDMEMVEVPKEQENQDQEALMQDAVMVPLLRETEEEIDTFVHVGLDRADESTAEPTDWAEPEAVVPYEPPTHVHVNTSAATWALTQALKQRYARFIKKNQSEFECLRITERAFWRTLDILWANVSFRETMKTILQENDNRYGRRNFETLLSGRRPTGRFNPYKCPNPNVLTVPYWYKTLHYVHTSEGLQQAMDYLESLRDFEWVALDTEGGGKDTHGEYHPCETIQFATKKESYVIDSRVCKAVVPKKLLRRFLSLLFTKGARFGYAFDTADLEKVVALVDGDSEEDNACRAAVEHSRVYPVNMLVDRAYNEGETDSGDETDEIDGLDRRPPGLPDYVVKRPRLAHYVHHVTKKKLSKAYTCSFWNVRPYLDEQLTYAHMDAICIILMLQRCTKMPGGRMALKDWLGEAALAEIDLDNVDN
ncbi:hypothetical protein AAVH_27231 [Aphelenchoides avenae]|nr:hypothetical protein AAVH_27231 [Aphelenchus avenae]